MTNPMLRLCDLEAIIRLSQRIEHGDDLITCADNTFASPYVQRRRWSWGSTS